MSIELTAQQKVERQTAHFDSIADAYHQARGQPNHRLLKQLIWRAVLDHPAIAEFCSTRTQLDVLEPMCGFADGKSILSDYVDGRIDYHGFDYSTEVVTRLKEKHPEVNVWQQDVSTFSSDDQYDIIILLGGLHHVPHIAGDVVKRLSERLSDTGIFISLEPTHGNRLFQSVREWIYRRNSLFDEQTERASSVAELRGFFESSGLEPSTIIYPGLLAYVLYYNPDAFPYLNIGRPGLVKAIWSMERPLVRGRLARSLSFATLSMWSR